MDTRLLTALAVFGGVAVLNSIFLAFLLFFHHSGLSRNKWLGLLFLSLSVRIGKSLLMLVFPNAPDSVPAIGLVGMVLTGPLFYFYIRAFYLNKNLDRTDFFHFLLAVVTSALLWLNSNTIVLVLYILAAVQLWGYMLWVWLQWRNYKHEHRGWIGFLWLTLVVMNGIYTSQIFIESDMAYLVSTIIASIVLYAIMFMAFWKQQVFLPIRKLNMTIAKAEAIFQQVVALMENEKLYTEVNVTISRVAERIGTKPYLVSQALSTAIGKSFPEFLNQYRIEEAKRMLTDPLFHHYSIEAIAFDCGFNTPSTFYTSFKKYISETPSEYRARFARKHG